jgi:hypothetical protein
MVPNPKLKFMEQCREEMRFHRLALRTEEAHLPWFKRFRRAGLSRDRKLQIENFQFPILNPRCGAPLSRPTVLRSQRNLTDDNEF